VPKRSIGDATVAAAQKIAASENMTLCEVFEHCRNYEYFSKKVSRIEAFTDFLREIRALSESVPVSELIKLVIVKSGYLAALEAEATDEAKDRIANLGALISSAAEYENDSEEPTLQGFLEEAALMSDIDNYDGSADTVTMMTVHSAKGLEFPVVFIAGLEEGIFPGQNSAYYPEELEEERRLAYVGITRAKEKLHMTYVRSRMLFGSTVYNRPSRFIAEVPDNLKDQPENLPRFVRSMGAPVKKPAVAEKPGISRPKSEGVSYIEGETVTHNTFGQGMVLSVKPMGGDILLEIAFEKYGTKKLMANFAKLKKI
jgi:DNA helicase-2/ATP-dependent DNA helicase PcrA